MGSDAENTPHDVSVMDLDEVADAACRTVGSLRFQYSWHESSLAVGC